ncbi:MAG: hypothetical protein U0T69_12170 [Chitinophagales bacterium]
MKNLSLLVLLYLVFVSFSTFSQDEIDIVDPYEIKVSRSKEADTFYFIQNATTLAVKGKLDTLRTYDVFLEERPTPFGTAYMCNGKEVTKQKFFEYKKFWNASGACTPCMLYTYDDKNQLKYNAFQYEDCLCGSYTEYYPEKIKKVEGQFKANTSGSWGNIKGRNLCNIRDGIWTYYLENGVIYKTETYVDGKLKEVMNTPVSSTKNKKENSTTSEPDDSESKKGLLQRMKDKNKETEN